MQNLSEINFSGFLGKIRKKKLEKDFENFWLALAYGMVSLDNVFKQSGAGEYVLVFNLDGTQRRYVLKDGRHIPCRKISFLLESLRRDPEYKRAISSWKKRFFEQDKRIVRDTKGYSQTYFCKGLNLQSNLPAAHVKKWLEADPNKTQEVYVLFEKSLNNLLRELVNVNYGGDYIDLPYNKLPRNTDLDAFDEKRRARDNALYMLNQYHFELPENETEEGEE